MRRKITLGGLEVTAHGPGCAALDGFYRDPLLADANTALQAARDHGIRRFDTAPMHGLGWAERVLDDFLREVAIPANATVVCTKSGRRMVSP